MIKQIRNGISVRTAGINDLSAIYELGKENFIMEDLKLPWTPENIAEIFQAEGITLVLVRNKKVHGFITGTVSGTDARIHWMVVSEKFRKKGLGKELVKIFMKEAKEAGSLHFFVDLNKKNVDTIIFFNKIKFTDNGRFIELTTENTGER